MKEQTYDNLEYEEASHQTELRASALGHALEAYEEAQYDRQKHEEHGEQHGWKDTLSRG